MNANRVHLPASDKVSVLTFYFWKQISFEAPEKAGSRIGNSAFFTHKQLLIKLSLVSLPISLHLSPFFVPVFRSVWGICSRSREPITSTRRFAEIHSVESKLCIVMRTIRLIISISGSFKQIHLLHWFVVLLEKLGAESSFNLKLLVCRQGTCTLLIVADGNFSRCRRILLKVYSMPISLMALWSTTMCRNAVWHLRRKSGVAIFSFCVINHCFTRVLLLLDFQATYVWFHYRTIDWIVLDIANS